MDAAAPFGGRFFPHEDPFWAETLEAARAAIRPGDTVSAHPFFIEFFPEALPYIALDDARLAGVDWIIFHKGSMGHAAPRAMRRIQEEFAPVFANAVFVLLADRRTAESAARREFDPVHAGALWAAVADFEKSPRPTGDRGLVDAIRRLAADRSLWPPEVEPSAEAGIVISACGRLFKDLHGNLRNIRARGCGLPVDVWHLPGEFTERQKEALRPMAEFVDAGNTPFNDLSGRHEVHGFKAWMLAHSRFQRTLMLDVNSFPLTGLGEVFASGEACILWADVPWAQAGRLVSKLRSELGIAQAPVLFESGQLFVDKCAPGMSDALRLAAALNTLGRRLYDYTYGDKETYSVAFDLLGTPYRIAPTLSIRRLMGGDGSAPGDVAFIQPWLDGTDLFYHPTWSREHWGRLDAGWAALEKEAMEAEAACT